MDIEALTKHATHAMTGAILREVQEAVKELRSDTSAIAPEHIVGYEAGFLACKRASLDALAP